MKDTLLKNLTILDGNKGMKAKEGFDILIREGKIAKIGKGLVDERAKAIDCSGLYALPGLINLHVHLPAGGKPSKKKLGNRDKLVKLITSNSFFKKIGLLIVSKYAKEELRSGTTTIRAVGGVGDLDSTYRDLVNEGKAIGPRIICANTAVAPLGGHMVGTVAKAASTIEEAEAIVQEAIDSGADIVKLMITGGVLDAKKRGEPGDLKMSPEMVKACCDKAHSLGYKVAAHVEGAEGFKVAVDCGVDTIEHGSSADDEALLRLKERDGALVCTFSPAVPFAKLSPEVMGYGEDAQYNSECLLDNFSKTLQKCLQLGIKVGFGTDTGCPFVTHYNTYMEAIYLTKYIKGIDNAFAIHSLTLGNAMVAGIEKETGSIEVGKSADLLLVKGNPLKDLKALGEPEKVFYRGELVKGKNKKYGKVDALLSSIV